MRFRWGWLEPVMPVPYVPTLGPVHPGDPLHDLFEAVVENAETGEFLPYDKDRRWSDRKTERVLRDHIWHTEGMTLVPTLVERGGRTVKVYVYGGGREGRLTGAYLAVTLAAYCGAAEARIVWFLGPDEPEVPAQSVTRVQLKDFTDGPGRPWAFLVQEYKQLHEPQRFAAFAERMADDGFDFLYDRMRAGTVGPVLVVVDGAAVAGAIGPMETMTDAAGRVRLMPQYFGVLPEHRGLGYGTALWRAAMHWGHQRGAAYQLLQTEVGGASDRLCAAEGLTSLGFVNQRDA